jgi:Asp-tRNA(Asn)/Glu-tRNA(Gln) amidotransferase A subunit family amidase
VTALHELTATQIAGAIDAGRTNCEAITRACLERIDAREPLVQAWAHIDREFALAQARALDAGPRRGPLHGVPFGVKDIIDTADLPTSYGTPIFAGHRPPADAACVALSRRAGGVLLGKTVTTEFANITHGPTRNPHDLTRTPGGSSSGSAAAVADHMVPLAIGTQTTGSTTRPASFCGIVGYRPTWGHLRTAGTMEASGTLDTLGVLARSVEDAALYRDVLLGVPPEPIAGLATPPRVALCRTPFWDQLEPCTRRALESAAAELARLGASVGELELPPHFAQLTGAHRWISGFEMSRNLAWVIDHRWDQISEAFRNGRLKDGLGCTFEQYLSMLALAQRCRDELDVLFEPWDVLLAPAAAGEAPPGWLPIPHPWVYMIWTVTQVPTVTLPLFHGQDGLPIGAQLIAKRHDDRRLFACARWVEQRLAH